MHLRHAISQFNALLYYRMASRGSVSSMETPLQNFRSYPDLSAHNIAALMPAAAQYSLHLPLHHCQDKVQRILRFVESECEVLPSKERCPYVVVVEVLEQTFDCKSEQLYTQGISPSVYLPSGVANGQILHAGQAKLPLSAGAVSPVSTTSVEALSESVDQRNSLQIGIPHLRAATKGTLAHSISRGTNRGKLLTDSLEHIKSSGGSSSNRYRRGHRLYPTNEFPSVTSRSDAQSLGNTLEQLQEAYELYDEASDSAASVRVAESEAEAEAVDLDGPAPPMLQVKPSNQHQNTQMFARPDAIRDRNKQDCEVDALEVVEPECERVEQGATEPASVSFLRGGGNSASEHPASSTHVPGKRVFSRSPGRHRRRIRSSTALPQGQEAAGLSSSPPLPPVDEPAREEVRATPKVFPERPFGDPRQYSSPARSNEYVSGNHGHSHGYGYVNSNGDEIWQRDAAGVDNEHSNVIDARPHSFMHDPTLQHHPHYQHQHQHLPRATGYPHPHAQLQQPRAYVRPRTWQERKAIVRASSPFGKLPGWDMKSFIVKSGDDLRKEVFACLIAFCCCVSSTHHPSCTTCVQSYQLCSIDISSRFSLYQLCCVLAWNDTSQVLAMQLMEFCKKVFEMEGLDIYLRPYQILRYAYRQPGIVESMQSVLCWPLWQILFRNLHALTSFCMYAM